MRFFTDLPKYPMLGLVPVIANTSDFKGNCLIMFRGKVNNIKSCRLIQISTKYLEIFGQESFEARLKIIGIDHQLPILSFLHSRAFLVECPKSV